ncbi:hypothetical protein CPJCM30710_05930 [Clostridium polyendosporum]|uniref:Flavin reductase like domain-containing protein n=1 Tax=Clostridium polyendosporum TaxID=69208 RepID=A0A919RWU2_9CLOT|nr:flavin reductase family protein [Clostridium polyendosporum]GIM27927.1 hypothetical protein CPJCM30710_05930 [Clostridium polyendosporum]
MAVDFIKGLEKGMENLHKTGAFLTVKNEDKVNTMTISWGSIGYMWGRPVLTVMVRKSRYTYELLEKIDNFTVSIPYGDKLQSALALCGKKSGRNTDKCKEANISFASSKEVDSPIVDNCNMYYECKVVYKGEMDKSLLIPEIDEKFYSNNDYHVLYFGEIVAAYENATDAV